MSAEVEALRIVFPVRGHRRLAAGWYDDKKEMTAVCHQAEGLRRAQGQCRIFLAGPEG